jgi:sulfopyruvate decarboxylase subunit alpha
MLAEIRAAGITDVVTVPDTHQKSLLTLLSTSVTPRLITVCTEDEAIGVNLGLFMGGRRPLLLIQNSGCYAAMNTLRALALDCQVPTPLLIGEFSRDPRMAPRDHPARLVHLLEPTLDLWQVPRYRLDHPQDLANVRAAVDHAWQSRGPVAVLVGATTGEVA